MCIMNSHQFTPINYADCQLKCISFYYELVLHTFTNIICHSLSSVNVFSKKVYIDLILDAKKRIPLKVAHSQRIVQQQELYIFL